MAHVIAHQQKILARVNRLIGQMNALKRDIECAESHEQCGAIMQQIASIRGAINGLSMLYLDEHVREHIARGKTVEDRDRAADEFLTALKSFRT